MEDQSVKKALYRKKVTGYSIIPTALLLSIANGPLNGNLIVGYLAISFVVAILLLFLSWFFIKCPKCKNLYFGSWQSQHRYKIGCRVCGDRSYE